MASHANALLPPLTGAPVSASAAPGQRTPSPYNHLPDTLSLTLKVLRRYKREGRALSAEEAATLAAIADEVNGFHVYTTANQLPPLQQQQAAGAGSRAPSNQPTATTTNVVGNRLHAALNHAAAESADNGTVTTITTAAAAKGLPPLPTANVAAAAAATPNNGTSSATSPLMSPNSTNNNEPARVKGLISKLRKAADSGEVFKELLVKSATVDSLVDFAVQCNEASNSRVGLANVIINGVKALGGRLEPLMSPLTMSLEHAAETGKEQQQQQTASNGFNGSNAEAAKGTTAHFYGLHNMRVFLLNKNNEVLEDPMTGEMIGNIGNVGATTANGRPSTTAGSNKTGSSTVRGSKGDSHAAPGAEGEISGPPTFMNSESAAAAAGGHTTAADAAVSASSGAPVMTTNADGSSTAASTTTTANQAALAVIVSAITDCFLSGANGDHLERANHMFLPLAVDGECLGVLAIFDYKATLDPKKMTVVSACQSVASLSVRNVGLLEDVNYQMGKANAMLQMANQLAFDNLDERTLSQSIIVTAKQLIDADRCSIFVVKGDTLQAYFEDGKTVIIPNSAGIAGHVARTGEVVNIEEAYEDARFNRAVDKATGYRTKTILCMPIRFGDQIVGVAQLINKRPLVVDPSKLTSNQKVPSSIARWEVERSFSSRDEELFSTFSTFVGVSLRNCRINQGLQTETERSKAFIEVVTMLSQTDIRDVRNIAAHVMAGAKKLLHADRSTLFLVDKEEHELYSAVADDNTTGDELRVHIGTGIAGKVAETQVAMNIVDAYKHPDFDPSTDKKLGYSTYSLLCEPITYHNEVLAVAQLMNKIDTRAGGADDNGSAQNSSTSAPPFTGFTEADSETFRTFAMFAGISISNAHMLQFAVEAGNELIALNNRIDNNNFATQMESSVSMDMSVNGGPGGGAPGSPSTMRRRGSMMSKRRVGTAERQAILDALAILNNSPEVDVTSPSFDLFLVRQKAENPSDMGCAVVLKVFQQTGFMDLFQVDTEVFLNFLCHCRRLYRKVPYHNFFHVVDACQTIYTFLFRGGIREVLTDLECFTLLVTALVHDLDHMGVNNSFHLKTDSPLGILSSATGNTSVLEVHHCSLAVELLSDPTANVFSGLDDNDRSKAIKSMIECILATDMARHGEFLTKFEAVTTANASAADGSSGLNLEDESHRKLVMDLVMKAADISNVTKPFELSRLWAVAVTEEFYRQGDQERARGVEVLPQFDRSQKTELAKGQIGFINFVCEKFFKTISSDAAFPGMRWTLDNLLRNKDEWAAILNGTTRRPSLIDLSPVPSPQPAGLKDVGAEAAAAQHKPAAANPKAAAA